jgi:hypothetical protein
MDSPAGCCDDFSTCLFAQAFMSILEFFKYALTVSLKTAGTG